jgi:hypothetical protein
VTRAAIYATQRGWCVTQIYQDRARGAKEKRPGLHALMTNAYRGQEIS